MEADERRVVPGAAVHIPANRTSVWWRHGRVVQVIAAVCLVWGGGYLVWRLAWTGRGVNPVLFGALFAAEVYAWVSLGLYAFLAWSVPTTTRPPLPDVVPTIDVFVCTYDEPIAVVEATLTGCRAIRVPHRTYLLDDGDRPEMAALASSLDAEHITRRDHEHAKAGNINHALGVTGGELILVLDADHVPRPDILDATVGYFRDGDVALVQTPHDFSNRDSVQHTKSQRHEQTLFYDVIAPGKDRHNAMFWCGSATLVRRDALTSVGGVLTDTVAEDFHTTIAMHARAWKTRYHAETLVQGRAPHDLAGFLLQRARWARGNLGVFRTSENPLTCRGLRPKQRLSYFASLFNYFSGLQRLVLLSVLSVTLASGQLPMHASALTLVALWLPWSTLAFLTTIALGRGALGPLDSTRYGLMTMGINVRGVLTLLRSRAGSFKVTPKEGTDDGGLKVLRMLWLLTTIGAAMTVAWLARVLAVGGVLSLPSMPPFATGVVIALGAWELACILKVLVPLIRRRQRRTRYRLPVNLRARAAGTTVRVEVRDLTSAGLAFEMAAAVRVNTRLELLTRLPDRAGGLHDTVLPVEVRSCRRAAEAGMFRVGCEIRELAPDVRQLLNEFCEVVVSTAQLAGILVPAAPLPGEPPPISWRDHRAS